MSHARLPLRRILVGAALASLALLAIVWRMRPPMEPPPSTRFVQDYTAFLREAQLLRTQSQHRPDFRFSRQIIEIDAAFQLAKRHWPQDAGWLLAQADFAEAIDDWSAAETAARLKFSGTPYLVDWNPKHHEFLEVFLKNVHRPAALAIPSLTASQSAGRDPYLGLPVQSLVELGLTAGSEVFDLGLHVAADPARAIHDLARFNP